MRFQPVLALGNESEQSRNQILQAALKKENEEEQATVSLAAAKSISLCCSTSVKAMMAFLH